ncbi:MAG: DUF3306 domain-containing protein [Betaproteobacteria bacterium]
MSGKASTPPGFSLKRWSQRKADAARAVPEAPPPSAGAPVAATVSYVPPGESIAPSAAAPLPPVESLTIDSDFTAFLEPKVDEGLRRQALRQLFRDPHFNVMDGLDTYIADYSIPDPISPEIVRQLVQSRYIFDPPKTRVSEAGVVEDVAADEDAKEASARAPEALPDSVPPASSVPTPNSPPDGVAGTQPAVPLTTAAPKPAPK